MTDESPQWARRAQKPGRLRMRPRDMVSHVHGWVLIPLLIAVYAAQMFWLPDQGLGWALSPQAIQEGRWETLVTHMFLHGGLAHLFFNSTAFASLQTPVILQLGRGVRGFVWFFLLYLACGLAGAAAYLGLHWGSDVPVVGASGAICGLWGAASRLSYGGRLTGLFDRQVWLNVRNFTVMNLILVGLFVLPQLATGSAEVRSFIAWEAHVGGFLLGLFAIPLFQRWSGWRAPLVEPWEEIGLGVPPTPR